MHSHDLIPMFGTSVFLVVVGMLVSGAAYAAGTDTHRACGFAAAKVAPEPFASNWDKCRGAVHADYMRDQPVGHENARIAGLLYTLEAIRYLREGQLNKAMLTASARTHYVQDGACIPHAQVWTPREEHDVLDGEAPAWGVFSFLPKSYQAYWLPFSERAPDRHYNGLRIEPPAFRPDAWQGCIDREHPGSMHMFFDYIHGQAVHPDGFPGDLIPSTDGWSTYDREFYGRWRAECIALDVLDRASVLAKDDPIKFTSAEGMQQALDDEMANMSATVASYYRYLTVAADTALQGDIEELLPGTDRLALLARRDPHIYLSADAPWPLKRAVYLLAMEMARARRRNEGVYWPAYGKTLKADADALFKTVAMPDGEDDQRIIIAWQEAEKGVADLAKASREGNVIAAERTEGSSGYIALRGADLQSTIHLVDYLLDLTWAPLNSRTPVDVLLGVFRKEWPGMPFLEDLRNTPDADVYPKFERLEHAHADDEVAWTDKVHWMVWPNVNSSGFTLSGPLPVFWNMLLLKLPLPDGKKLDLTKM